MELTRSNNGLPVAVSGMIRRAAAIAAICLLVTALGCGHKGPQVQFVEGRVLLDGEPIEGCDVGFSPLTVGLSAYGRTNAAGLFRLTTVRGGRPLGGAQIGDYAVTVVKWRNRLDDLGPKPDPADAAASARWQVEADRLMSLPADYIVPKAYGDKATSPLRATVRKGRNTGPDFTFELSNDFTPGK